MTKTNTHHLSIFMKRFTLSLAVLFVFAAVFGQKIKPGTSIKPYSSFEKTMDVPEASRLKGEGEIFSPKHLTGKIHQLNVAGPCPRAGSLPM